MSIFKTSKSIYPLLLGLCVTFLSTSVYPNEAFKSIIKVPQGLGPFPVIIYSHGSGGLGSSLSIWQPIFEKLGFASIFIDHYSPRGYGRSPEGREGFKLNLEWRRDDLVSALIEIRTNRRLDASRITLMGASTGSNLVLMGILNDNYRRRAGLKEFIKTAVLFYPSIMGCIPRLTSQFYNIKPLKLPVLYLVGSLDTLVRVCWDDLLVQVESANHPQVIKIYEGGEHAFDTARRSRPCRTVRFRGNHNLCSKFDQQSFADSVKDVSEFLLKYGR